MIGSIDDPRILARIGNACGQAAADVRHRLTKAAHKEAEGQSGPREETSTQHLSDAIDDIDALGASLAEDVNREEIASDGKRVRIEFMTEKAPQGEESAFGLDLGIRIIIETPGYSTQKAILVQCKRMFGVGTAGEFKKLRGDGEIQARKMLSITPASFFFLFNSGGREELFGMMRSPPYVLLPGSFEPGPWPPAYFDPGVTVLPAARVLAMADSAKAEGRAFPTGAAEVLPASRPLGEFITGLFAPCLVGDVRLPLLQLATPPARRSEIVGGLEADVPPLGTLQPNRYFEFRFAKEGDPGERDRPRRRRRSR